MATALIQTTGFHTGLGFWLVICNWLQAWVLKKAGFTWTAAFWDAGITNVTLVLVMLVVSAILHFYAPRQNRYSYLLGLCAVLTAVWIPALRVLLMIANEEPEYRAVLSKSMPIRGAVGFLFIACTALISLLWQTLQEAQESESRKAETERLSREAELTNLRQQLQPHFLFNSLNSVNALIGSRPAEARAMVQRLSDFLRGTLKKDNDEWTSLNDELAHLQLYLAIEKVRFGHRLLTEIENTADDASLPVMLLQPVVENAIKFGLYDTTEAVTIRIHATKNAGDLLIQITNPYDAQTAQRGTGFGLTAVQRRLYLLFARTDLLQTSKTENVFTTLIKIPQA